MTAILDEALLELCGRDVESYFPSPYGGAILLERVEDAINGGSRLLKLLTANDIEASVAVTHGTFEKVYNVTGWNTAALALNIAARMAFLPENKGKIAVSPAVMRLAQKSNTGFRGIFGAAAEGEVKGYKFTYHLVNEHAVTAPALNNAIQQLNGMPETISAAVLVVDIEKYSRKVPADQERSVEALNRCLENTIGSIGTGPSQFGPAGDGGYLVFPTARSDRSSQALLFARELTEHAVTAGVHIRIGISIGPVIQTDLRPAVGGTVLEADRLASCASRYGLAASLDFWNSVPHPQQAKWELKSSAEDPEIVLLSPLMPVVSPGDMPAKESVSARVPHNLPSPSQVSFVDREAEFAQAADYLRPYPDSQYPIVAIDGPGGVGKTSLALQLAYHFLRDEQANDMARRFSCILWTSAKREVLDSSGIVPHAQSLRNIEDLFSQLGTTLNQPQLLSTTSSEQEMLARNIMANNRVLLIIDNLETVEDPRLMQLLRSLPAPTKCIVTTRRRIDGAVTLRLEGLPTLEARLLIDNECTRQKIVLSADDKAKLAKETGGIPLAIVYTLGQLGLGRSLETCLLRLKSAGGDYARFSFFESVELLKEKHHTPALWLLMSLAHFADQASAEALGFVSGLADPEIRDEGLSVLVAMGLVNYNGTYFSLLPLTKYYVLSEVGKDMAFSANARTRWFQWHLSITNQAIAGRVDLDSSVLNTIQQEHANILWCLDEAYKTENLDIYVKMLRGMEFFWLGSGFWKEYDSHLNRASLLAPNKLDRIHFLARLAWLNLFRGDYSKAQSYLDQARVLLPESADRYEMMRVYDFSGQLAMQLRRFEQAQAFLRQSLDIAQAIGDRRGQFACLKYLGEIACALSQPEEAKDYLKAAEPFAERTAEDRWVRGLAHVEHLRGLIAVTEKRFSDAIISLQKCREYLAVWPDVRLRTVACDCLVAALIGLGEYDRARDTLRENIDTYARLGMKLFLDKAREQMETLNVDKRAGEISA